MKNSNLFKKFATIVMAAMMVLSTFAMPTFAADSVTLKVNDVEPNATVKAYKVVEKDANNNWQMVSGYGSKQEIVDPADASNTIEAWVVEGTYDATNKTGVVYDFENPSSDALTALAAIAQDGKTASFTFAKPTQTEPAFTKVATKADPGVGSFLVLATSSTAQWSYNPMLVSVNPQGENGVLDPKVDDDGNIVDSNGTIISAAATEVHAKRSEIPFEKVVERDNAITGRDNSGTNQNNLDVNKDEALVNADGIEGFDGNRGDTAGRGDVVKFRINTAIPAYEDNYFVAEEDGTYKVEATKKINGKTFYNPQFNVYDTLSDGLVLKADSVKVYALDKVQKKITELDKTKGGVELYRVITENAKAKDGTTVTFKVEFTPAGVKEYAGKNIEIHYAATVKANVGDYPNVTEEGHGVNFDGEKNEAYPEFTRNPGEDCQGGPHKKTYHYTFTINGKVNGDGSNENREVIKVGLDNSGAQVFRETSTVTADTQGWKPLQNVVFKLYKAKVDQNGDWVKTSGTPALVQKEGIEIRTVTSDADGILRGMDQLDAGKYVLIEDSLGPNTEYSKNTTPIGIEIAAQLDEQGRLASYQVKVNDITVGNYKKTYTDTDTEIMEGLKNNGVLETLNDAGNVVDQFHKKTFVEGTTTREWTDTDAEAADIRNSKQGTLPSTGGMGTVAFTVGGIAIMMIALFLLMGGKKKKEENQ